MNRLSPLIVRRAGPMADIFDESRVDLYSEAESDHRYEDLKLFATGWVGGLIFFGTLLG